MKKVEIIVKESNYSKSHKDGASYISVSYSGARYGSASPCDTPKQVTEAIKDAREKIIKEGDRPILNDTRGKLTNWL